MKKMRFIDIPSCFRLVMLGVICMMISACSKESDSNAMSAAKNTVQQDVPAVEIENQDSPETNTTEPADNAGNLIVPAKAFFRALLSLNKNITGGGNLNFHMPAIWIFSPQGDLVRIVQDEQALAAFKEEFSGIDSQAPSMSCHSIEQAVLNIAQETWDMGCADGKWIALLLASPTQCEGACTEYKSVLAQMEQEHQAALQVRTLLVDLRA